MVRGFDGQLGTRYYADVVWNSIGSALKPKPLKGCRVDDWPFDDPPNVASITVRQIVHGGEPILLVAHDAEDGGWQFLTGGEFEVADGMVVSLASMVRRDPSVAGLADLPLGWQAARAAVGQPWQRSPG